MAKRKTAVADTESDTNGTNGAADNGTPRKTVKRFSVQCGKDSEHLHVDVVESEHMGRDNGKFVVLSCVCSRSYAKADGELGTSYSYRAGHVPLLVHLLNLAHAFIVGQRVVVDEPVG